MEFYQIMNHESGVTKNSNLSNNNG